MHRKPDATGDATPLPLRLLACVLADDPDRALALGLMDYLPGADDDRLDPAHPDLSARLLSAQRRLQAAWDARARHRARAERLARRAAERDARRAPAPLQSAQPSRPALPPLAAAILARAKARAASGSGA